MIPIFSTLCETAAETGLTDQANMDPSIGGRVLMLLQNNSFPWDRRVFHEVQALQRAGCQVTVICPTGEQANQRAFKETAAGVQIYRYPMLPEARGKLGYIREYMWALLCTSILSLFVCIVHGFDIIHAANPPDIFFLVAAPFKLLGKKYVYDEHDLCPELYSSKFNRKGMMYHLLLTLQRLSYYAADLVVSPNESYREIAKSRGRLAENRLAVVRNGVDIQDFHRGAPRPELKQGFSYMVVYLGVMGRQDGVDRVVRAAHHVVYDIGRRDVLFVLIGKGECWLDLQELSRELKVEQFVRFTGRIPDDVLLEYLSTSEVCLAPDPPDEMNQLSTMTKIMEYMACGNPIVSFDLLESRRSAAEAAVYVPGSDPKDFARALSTLLDDAGQRERMSQVGIARSTHLVGLNRSRQALWEGYGRLRAIDKK